MKLSIRNTLPLWILFFTCSFLHAAEAAEENLYPKYQFYEKEDCVKVKIVLPVGEMAKSTLFKIDNPNSKGVAVQIKNDSLKRLEAFYQLVDIKIYAVPSQEGEVMFEIIENLEKKPTGGIIKDTITNSSKYIIKTDKQVDFRDVIPKLTVNRDAPNIKYVRFFTKP